MARLIDTSIFVQAERGRLDIAERMSREPEVVHFMSVITVSELLVGVHLATPEFREKRSKAVEYLITEFPTLDVNIDVAREHSRLFAQLRASGQLIGIHDMWIAAICLANDLDVVTANVSEFERVEGLNVLDWTK